MFDFENVEWCFYNAKIVKEKIPVILSLPAAYLLPPELRAKVQKPKESLV